MVRKFPLSPFALDLPPSILLRPFYRLGHHTSVNLVSIRTPHLLCPSRIRIHWRVFDYGKILVNLSLFWVYPLAIVAPGRSDSIAGKPAFTLSSPNFFSLSLRFYLILFILVLV